MVATRAFHSQRGSHDWTIVWSSERLLMLPLLPPVPIVHSNLRPCQARPTAGACRVTNRLVRAVAVDASDRAPTPDEPHWQARPSTTAAADGSRQANRPG